MDDKKNGVTIMLITVCSVKCNCYNPDITCSAGTVCIW